MTEDDVAGGQERRGLFAVEGAERSRIEEIGHRGEAFELCRAEGVGGQLRHHGEHYAGSHHGRVYHDVAGFRVGTTLSRSPATRARTISAVRCGTSSGIQCDTSSRISSRYGPVRSEPSTRRRPA